jgi:O-antigen ligase
MKRDWLRSSPLEALEVLEVEDYLVLTPIVLLPWAFGGVEIWAYRSAALLLVAGAGLVLARDGWSGLFRWRDSRWLVPALLLGLWAGAQLVPLPPDLLRAASPVTDAIYRETYPGYPGQAPADVVDAIEQRALAELPEVPVPPAGGARFFTAAPGGRWSGWRAISLSVPAGVERLLWYVALLTGFLVVRRRVIDPEVDARYRNALYGTFIALAVFGLIQAATSNGKVFWIRAVPGPGSPFGPYVNPTNFASVMELAVPWLTGHAIAVVRDPRRSWMDLLRRPVTVVGALLCVLAALASASRFPALAIGASLTLLALFVPRGLGARLTVAAAAVAGWAGAFFLLRGSALGTRVQELLDSTAGGVSEVNRLVAWEAALPMLSDFRWVGVGLGAFRDAFVRYMPTGEMLLWSQLHNDYLQFLIEAGIVGGVLLAWLVVAFWARTLRPLRAPGPMDFEYIGLLLGLGSLSLHGLVDFNHQIPANALLFVAMAAIAVARVERLPGPPRVP